MLELRVIQVKLLREALLPISYMVAEANINYSPSGLSLLAVDSINELMVVLQIKSSDFHYFRCNENSSAGVNVIRLCDIVGSAFDDEVMSIRGYDDDDLIDFVFSGFIHGSPYTRCVRMSLIPFIEEHVDTDVSQYEYEVVVGIPSGEFRNIIMHLCHSGTTVYVSVTDKEVTLCTETEVIILKKEEGECIIGGAATEHPVYVLFGLYDMRSFLCATYLSNMVWILHSHSSPDLLNIPFGVLGNIKYFFI